MGVTGSLLLGGLSGYNIWSAEDQKRQSKEAQKKQEDSANALILEKKNKETVDSATAERDMNRRRQNRSSSSRANTVPLASFSNNTQLKTLLGI